MKNITILLVLLGMIIIPINAIAIDKYWDDSDPECWGIWSHYHCWSPLGVPADGDTIYLSNGNLQALTNEYIGESSTSTFIHTGGTNSVTDDLHLGYSTSGDGTYDLSGTSSLSASNEYIGYAGTGTFTQTGGTNTVTDDLSLGYNSSGNGTYDLSGTGSLSAYYEYIG